MMAGSRVGDQISRIRVGLPVGGWAQVVSRLFMRTSGIPNGADD